MKVVMTACVSVLTLMLAAPLGRAADIVTKATGTRYADKYHGRPMKGGQVCRALKHGDGIFRSTDPTLIAAAEGSYRFGTRLRVVNGITGQSLIGRVCDRGSFGPGHLDFSKKGARQLGFKDYATTLYVTVIN